MSPAAHVSSPTLIDVDEVPLVSKSLTYPKCCTKPFTPLDIDSVARPINLTSLTDPSATYDETLILPLGSTPDA